MAVTEPGRIRNIAVAGQRPNIGSIAQIGLVIVPPDFTGDINNYTLWYYTSDAKLATQLREAGVNAQHVPTLDYDYDLDMHSQWASLGGYTIGKAKFLRSVMAKFPGVNKPLFLNETGLTCPIPPNGPCAGAGSTFFQAQADYVIRMLTRGWSIGVQQITWYTLQGPGWDNSGLVDAQQRPVNLSIRPRQVIP